MNFEDDSYIAVEVVFEHGDSTDAGEKLARGMFGNVEGAEGDGTCGGSAVEPVGEGYFIDGDCRWQLAGF